MPHPSPPPPETPAASSGSGGVFTLVHPDIIQTHILSRLDGPGLASAACASSQLRSLSSKDELWRDICTATWPSTADPKLDELISALRSGFRSLYADAYPLLQLPIIPSSPLPPSPITKLISAVDVFCGGDLLFSKVQEMETSTPWFMSTPFRIDLLEPKEPAKTMVLHPSRNNMNMVKHLEENLSLRWILIDPTHKRAVNLLSRQPVSVHRDWLSGGIQVRFSSILGVDREECEPVECHALVTCRWEVAGIMEVTEISLRMEDVHGRGLSGDGSLVILAAAMAGGRRTVHGHQGEEERITVKERFEEFGEMKRRRREQEHRRERALDMACIGVGIAIFAGFFLWLHALVGHNAS